MTSWALNRSCGSALGQFLRLALQDGATALILAAEAGNFAAVSLLVEHNANIEAADAEGWQALHAVRDPTSRVCVFVPRRCFLL